MNHPLKWLGLLLISLLLVVGMRLPAIAQNPRHYTDLTFPTLREITLPQYERYQLKNGMVVYLIEDHELPLVGGSAMIHTGGRLEPADKLGLAQLTGTVMRSGGTQDHSSSELNEILEQLAASVESGIDTDVGIVGFSGLSQDTSTIFPLFTEVIRYPIFEPQQLTLAKTQLQGAIARRNDDPGDIASREFRKLIYGENSPYARTIEYKTLDNIKREDLQQFHQTYVRPDQIILGIVGDFDPVKMKQLINDNLGQWEAPQTPAAIDVPSATQKIKQGIFLVNQPQLTQSNIRLGHLGGELNSPDYPALTVVNGVLNGFTGRLFNDLRSRQGLAYTVYGVWNPAYDYPGLFLAGGQTRSETTGQFIQALDQEIGRLRTTPITPEELTLAQDSILNSFVFKFENPSQTLSRLMRYEYFGYPSDFIFQYQAGVKATTIEDVERVAQKYLNPDQFVTLVVGNAQETEPLLTQLGVEVQFVDIAIPLPREG